MKNAIFGAIVVILLATAAYLYIWPKQEVVTPPPVVVTPPPPTGPPAQPFADEIRVFSPQPNDIIKSPFKLAGKARGSWFFEANMPVSLLNATGHKIKQLGLHATSTWMTDDFVPFEGTLTFTAPTSTTGFLKFENDNPSGMEEHSKSFIIPVRFQ